MFARFPSGKIYRLSALLMLAFGYTPVGAGREKNLADLSIEELMNESVTSVGKKATRLSESPTAIATIGADDFRRLGITDLPEAFRMVPGMNVARANSSIWAISSRGFNSPYANKLLVMVDGRSVYTPLFGGTYWDAQDTVLEDIDHIEVIRGPGATLWGANAVNGVINIMSKDAKNTQGGLIASSFGTIDRPAAAVRFGGAISSNLHFRIYAKSFDHAALVDPGGRRTPDAWRSRRAGYRADWQPSTQDHVTIQGDYYRNRLHEAVTLPLFAPPFSRQVDATEYGEGGNVLGRWTRTLSDHAHVSAQFYWDRFRHEGGLTVETRDTSDLEVEHRFSVGGWNDIVSGFGYRFSTDEVNNTTLVSWKQASRDLQLFTAFVQDEITLIPDRLRLTVGVKFEHNDITGVETQPSIRLLWLPIKSHTFWSAVSRAISTPTRFYRDARLNTSVFPTAPGGPLMVVALISNPNPVSESLRAFEAGYRFESATHFSIDVATFYNVYHHVNGTLAGKPEFEASPALPHLLLPLNFRNDTAGESYGAEVSMQWKPMDGWRMVATYTRLELRLQPIDRALKANARQQAGLRSYLNLTHDLELNSAAYYVAGIEGQDGAGTVPIPGFLRFDLGLVWRPTPRAEYGIWGQNLLDKQHPEITTINTRLRTEIPRSLVGRVTWRF